MREELLNLNDIEIKEIYVKEWNHTLHIKVMSGDDLQDIEEAYSEAREKGNKRPNHLRAMIAQKTLCDSQGNLIFKSEDIPLLSKKSQIALDYIFDESTKLNKFGDEAIKELAGNSNGDRT